MKKITMLLSLSLAFILVFVACEGPAGPRGYDGYDGRDGRDGVPGMETIFFEMYQNDWFASSDQFGRWFYTINMPEITEDVVNNGAVLCYRRANIPEYEAFEAMPITTLIREDGIQFTNELWYSHSVGKLDIDWWDSHPTDPIAPGYDMYFKIVILHPSSINKLDGVDVNDYNAVAKVLELDDRDTQVINSKDFKIK